MLEDRGYEVPDDSKYYCAECDPAMGSDDCECYNSFVDWVGEDEDAARSEMTVVFAKRDGSHQIMTFWTTNYGVENVRKIEEQMTQHGIKHSIVVYTNKISSNAGNTMKNLKIQGFIIEPFHESEVQYVVTRSSLVPKHIICSKTKAEEVLKAYNITKDQLPEIKSTDPIVRYIGARKGQLIKIVRPSESVASVFLQNPGTGASKDGKIFYDIFYRLVV